MAKRRKRNRNRYRNRNRKIIAAVACAVVLVVGVGTFCYYKYTTDQAIAETDDPEQEVDTEVLTEEITQEPTTEEPTTEEPTTEAQMETGSIRSGKLPPSADYFIMTEEADKFFEHSVFIGDSVMMGFRNFVMGQPAGFLGGPEFLVSGSFSVRMALNEISKDTIHPIYQGEQRYIWDSISMMGAEKVFLFFGLNDIGMEGVDGACENYLTVIEKIQEVNPNVSIYVISTTNMLTGSEKGKLNNENIRLLNEKMKEYCETGAAEYIDIANFLIGEDGGLKKELCSDDYVHQTYAAYEIWTKVLRGYASGGNYWLELPEPETETESGEVETGTGEQPDESESQSAQETEGEHE